MQSPRQRAKFAQETRILTDFMDGIIKMNNKISKAKQLRNKYESDLKILQDRCSHKKHSDWMEYHWAPGHAATYQVKVCLDCDKIVAKSAKCWGCKKPLTDTEINSHGQYCTSCVKKNMSLLTR